jgi:PRC-barrel domain
MEAIMLNRLVLISAVSALALGSAIAQDRPATSPSATTTPTTSTDTKSTDAQFVSAQKSDQFIASKFKGTDVMGPDDQKVGDVSDLLFDKAGKIEAYVISVGGFLGMGSKDVALPPTAFQMVPGDPSSATNKSPKLKISMTKDQLKNAPNFEPYKEPRATTGAGGAGGGATRPSPGGMAK